VRFVVKSLGNRELCESLIDFAHTNEEISESNVFARLSLADLLEASTSSEIDYLASHFWTIERSVLKSLSHRDLMAVVSSAKLQVETEDSLLDFVLEVGDDNLDLLGYVRSEYLSSSGIDRLLNSISLSEIDEGLWASLCSRLRLSVQPPVDLAHPRHWSSEQFPFESSRPFDGVMSHFVQKCGGNPHRQGVISIAASSGGNGDYGQVADHNLSGWWCSGDEADQWIQFDFKNHRISVTNYTIKSDGNVGTRHHLVQ
jgi:hypothetical protein